VLWVATANVVDAIPAPLRDRMEVLHLPGYDLGEKVEIARRFIVPRQRRACGLDDDALELPDRTVEVVVDRYTREAGLRGLERQLGAIARKVARAFAEGSTGPVRVEPGDVERFLGPRKHDPDRPDDRDRVGLATGLAWTEVGGSILHVEATLMPGKPGLTLTGQLGNVMRESALAALSSARARARELGLRDERLRDHELHVHVPNGAIPKDGPSAGVTMAAAMVSALSDRPVRRDVALTGEITLRGRVLAVGGLREKLLAAVRAGIPHVVVPAACEPDLAELPPRLFDRLRIHLVRELEEVLALALAEGPAREPAPPLGPGGALDP
jgi:ATP-dependent Lon protease